MSNDKVTVQLLDGARTIVQERKDVDYVEVCNVSIIQLDGRFFTYQHNSLVSDIIKFIEADIPVDWKDL